MTIERLRAIHDAATEDDGVISARDELRVYLAGAVSGGLPQQVSESVLYMADKMVHESMAVVDAIVTEHNTYAALLDIAEAWRLVATLSDGDVRDYEQGACFFCGATSEKVSGERKRRYIHTDDCSWVRGRAALDRLDEVAP